MADLVHSQDAWEQLLDVLPHMKGRKIFKCALMFEVGSVMRIEYQETITSRELDGLIDIVSKAQDLE